jgi:hypothetical protein
MGSFLGTTGSLPNPHSQVPGALVGGVYYLFGISNATTGVTDQATLDGMGGLTAFGGSAIGIMTHNRWGGPLISVGPDLVLYGGNAYSGGVVKMDPSTDTIPIGLNMGTSPVLGTSFTNVGASPPVTARRGAVGTAVGNYVYVLGGYGNTDLNSIEVAPLK